MVASVREGKLISMEGGYDHIVKRGSLCVKGIFDVLDNEEAAVKSFRQSLAGTPSTVAMQTAR